MEEPFYYVMRVPFPDEDQYSFVTYESGMFEGDLVVFTDEDHAAHWAWENDIGRYELVKKMY